MSDTIQYLILGCLLLLVWEVVFLPIFKRLSEARKSSQKMVHKVIVKENEEQEARKENERRLMDRFEEVVKKNNEALAKETGISVERLNGTQTAEIDEKIAANAEKRRARFRLILGAH